MPDNIDKEVTDLVAQIVEMDRNELWDKRSQHFVTDLGIDSMLALEILASLEKKYRIEIPEENVLDLTTLDSTINLVRRRLTEAAA
ncbi:MAG: acyl carrier protein [Planctomycetota bacterium]|nr:MAG: acyl carrier protein [Planctomycetota bacterium]